MPNQVCYIPQARNLSTIKAEQFKGAIYRHFKLKVQMHPNDFAALSFDITEMVCNGVTKQDIENFIAGYFSA